MIGSINVSCQKVHVNSLDNGSGKTQSGFSMFSVDNLVKQYFDNPEMKLSLVEKEASKNQSSISVGDTYIDTVKHSLNDALKSLGKLRPWDQKKGVILFFKRLVEKVLLIIDSVVEACGIRGFFDKEKAQGSEVQKILTVLSFISAISALCLRLGQFVFLATFSAATILIFVLLSLIWPSISPMPHRLEATQNLTAQTRSATLILSTARQQIVDELAEQISPDTPLLIDGKSGVGKTTLIHALAQRSDRGYYPSLKGKRFFYLSADAIRGGELNKITLQIQKHSKNIVLVVDNLHLISRVETAAMTEFQKFILDNQASGKCSIIAMENSQASVKSDNLSTYASLEAKFSKITLNEMVQKDKEELLYETFYQKREKVFITRGQMEELARGDNPVVALHQKMRELKKAERKDLFENLAQYKRTLEVIKRINQLTVQIAKSKKAKPQLLAKHYVVSKILEGLIQTDPSKLKPTELEPSDPEDLT